MFEKSLYNFIFLLNFFFVFSSIKTFTFFSCFKKSAVTPEKITKKFSQAISLYLSEFGKKISEIDTGKRIMSIETGKNGEFTIIKYSKNNGFGPYFTQIIRTIDNKVILDDLKNANSIIFSASQSYVFIIYFTGKFDLALKPINNSELIKIKNGQLIKNFENIVDIQASEIEDMFIIKKPTISNLNEFESEVIKIENDTINYPIKIKKTKNIKFLKNHKFIFTHYISKNENKKKLLETKTFKEISLFNEDYNYLKFSRDGNFFVSKYKESQYGLFETQSKNTLFAGRPVFLKYKFCPMQRYAFIRDSSNKGLMFDLQNFKILWTTDDVNYFKFSPSGKNILVKRNMITIEMIDSETGQKIWQDINNISNAFFSAKNNYLLLISFLGSLFAPRSPGELRNPENGEKIFEKFNNLNIVYRAKEFPFDENENFFIKQTKDENEIISLRKDYFRSKIKKSNLNNNILTILDENNIIGIFELSKSCGKLSQFKTNLLKCSKELSFDKEKKDGFCDTKIICDYN